MEQARWNMVEQQIRPWGVNDRQVLELFKTLKRENFVPEKYCNLAFADWNVPLPCGQTMFSPSVEARLLQALQLNGKEKVLHIGAGSGFLTALLARQAQQVIALEIEAELAQMAQGNLQRAQIDNAMVIHADGALGWPEQAPYDVIVVGAALPWVAAELVQQLKIGARLAAFVGQAPLEQLQLLTRTQEHDLQTQIVLESEIKPLLNASPAPIDWNTV